MNISERRSFVNEKVRCYNCLSDSHTVKFCKSKRSCQICRKRHNSLLHISGAANPQSVSQPATLPSVNSLQSSPNTSSKLASSTFASSPYNSSATVSDSTALPTVMNIGSVSTPNIHQSEKNIQQFVISNQQLLSPNQQDQPNNLTVQALLPTAIVHVTDACGHQQPCRVLLDSGSQASFVTEECVKRLALPRHRANVSIKGVGSSTAGTTRGATILEISSRAQLKPKLIVNALILPKVTAPMPSSDINSEFMNYLKSLPLADPTYYKPSSIDILIGAEFFFEVLTEGKFSCGQGGPTAQNTIFGWIVSGNTKTSATCNSVQLSCSLESIDCSLRKFWEIEEIPPTKILTEEERLCEIHFEETHRRTKEGKFVVKLPFKQSKKPLGETRNMAIRRLFAMETKFKKYPDLKQEYVAFVREYISLGHMERILPIVTIRDPNTSFYMPHHAVYKQSSTTTKIRVVFDASAKSSTQISLNDNLMVGPTVQNSLFAILVRFRKHPIVFTSDIEKMYRQIQIAKEDTDFQRIVWRENPDLPIEDYRLLTVTYGTASAPFLATKPLVTIADQNTTKYPAASKIIKQDLYMDDLMSGGNNQEDALMLQGQLIEIFKAAGFHLRKWTSNCPALLKAIPTNCQELSPIEISEGTRSIKLLGLEWCPKNDYFHFKVSVNPRVTNTKREMLSEASKIFDPLGWLSPSIVMIKILFQSLWLLNLQWDDPLPMNIAKKWIRLREELVKLENISIPRWLQTNDSTFQLHGFSDASEKAYSAVIYSRTKDSDGSYRTTILSAKTKVSPIKHTSIPRLELCAALLLTRLMKTVLTALHHQNVETFMWTDSANVLWWLSSHPRSWKSYVANRTTEILETTTRSAWRYVPTKDNPADCASRGLLPSMLENYELWWKGPPWLLQAQENWPDQRKVQTFADKSENKTIKVESHPAKLDKVLLAELAQRYSTMSKLVRIVARLFQFINNSKRSAKQEARSHTLSPIDFKTATGVIISWAQKEAFETELRNIKQQRPLPKSSKLAALNPFIDDHGLLRVGSRLRNASISYDMKFPVILPTDHVITNLILNETHLKYFHAAQSIMITTIRQRYWIINCKSVIRKHIHKCVTCTRYRASRRNQLMGDLPPERVNLKHAFYQVGVDYAGPIWLKAMTGRRCTSHKAVHIELVSNLTTDAFIASLKRFMSRRGVCADIFSDNGTNFLGARNVLFEIQKLHQSKNQNELISNFLLEPNTRWHFIPPSAPNFGGLWEAAVKSTKYHIRRVLGNQILNFEEMTTFLVQIEALLNSRPLCLISSQEEDALTPAHFLIGEPLTMLPDLNYKLVEQNRLSRWRLVQQLMQHFWSRWHKEYLMSLHNRSKWQHKHKNLKIDDIVLIRDENVPPARWPLGKIIATHPGQDGAVRVVTLKTKVGTIKRPIVKLVLLPVY